MENFTPISGAIGGAMIGLAAVLFMLVNGRIAGISGIVGGLIGAGRQDVYWRLAFIFGLFSAAPLYLFASGGLPPVEIPPTWDLMAVGGLLVGFGTAMGSGCTSGHGVCGVARLSSRSLVATATFMAVAILTVYILRHVGG